MDFGNKLEELNMTRDEINCFSKAMKDEKFCELLHEYVEEISNPENKKKYEEEITQLEQERGIEVKFIHPEAHHVLKTSANGKEKCFINICSNNLISKPTCDVRKAENGQTGQYWSLPYSVTPVRPDRDGKGNKCLIYDVIFHSDTLDMAGKNTRFMNLVNSTAIQGVMDAFKVTLEKTNTLLKKIKYYGVPQPVIIRKPISDQHRKEESSLHTKDLPIIYPDTMPIKNTKPLLSSLNQSPIKQSSLLPIQPHYTVKYRSLVDLQDYRYSRDSAPSTRPKEIVITINLPLLKSTEDVDLNVTERKLVLESRKPDYKLELELSYPVDADKGDAKFNKAKKQLTVSLAIQPGKNPAVFHIEGNQPENDDIYVMGFADKADQAVCETELVKDEQSELNTSEASCKAQPEGNNCVKQKQHKEDTHFSSVEVDSNKMNSLDSNAKYLHVAREHATLNCEINNTEALGPSENAMNWPKKDLSGVYICPQKMSLDLHANKETGNNQDKDDLPSGIKSVQSLLAHAPKPKNCTKFSSVCKITNGSKHKFPVVESEVKQTASHLEETLKDVKNLFSCVSGKSEVEPSAFNDGQNHLNSPLDKGTIESSCVKVIGALSEYQSSCTKLNLVPLSEEVDNNFTIQRKTALNITTPAILKQKNPEDDSEIVIVDHTTSAALSFQNSLWFELD